MKKFKTCPEWAKELGYKTRVFQQHRKDLKLGVKTGIGFLLSEREARIIADSINVDSEDREGGE